MYEGIFAELQWLGFTPFFDQQLRALDLDRTLEGTVVGRIACERRGEFQVEGKAGRFRAALSGRLEHLLAEDRPAVGDWVVLEPAQPVGRIHAVLPRQSSLRRLGVDGTSRAQVLAANIDVCCVVCALTSEDVDERSRRRALNPRRIERYLRMAQLSNVPALVLVNKADVLPQEGARERVQELRAHLAGARVLLVSAQTGYGLDELGRELVPGSSAVMLGSSGVGKSTLVNALIGDVVQRTGAERQEDTRGRHTTTERQLLRLQNGALLIDTPGMRELRLWADTETDVDGGLSDLQALAGACRFRDCQHEGEPGCAVRAAIDAGQLAPERLQHALKLRRELIHQQSRHDARLRRAQHSASKAMTRAARLKQKAKGRS